MFLSGFTVFSQSKDWKRYNSSMAGFEVGYPSDWRVKQEEAKGGIWRVTINSPGVRDDDVWEHNSITICSKPKKASFETLDRCAEHHLPVNKHKIVSEKTFTLNGLEIRKIETKEEFSSNSIFFVAFFSTKDRDFQVSGFFRKIFNLERFVPVFDQMLTTFQPATEKSVVIYKNEKYDFALTYPTTRKSCSTNAINYNPDEETILRLVPNKENCLGNNYISVLRMTKLSNKKNNLEVKGFLNAKDFTKPISYIEFGNIGGAIGEKVIESEIYRERYFYTNYPQTYELLKISEMYEINNETYQKEAMEILTTARRFLKFQ